MWLLGGLAGELWFGSIFVLDFIGSHFGRDVVTFGVMTGLFNFPGVLLVSLPFIPPSLRVSTAFQIAAIAVTNFGLGAVAGLLVKHAQRKSRDTLLPDDEGKFW